MSGIKPQETIDREMSDVKLRALDRIVQEFQSRAFHLFKKGLKERERALKGSIERNSRANIDLLQIGDVIGLYNVTIPDNPVLIKKICEFDS